MNKLEVIEAGRTLQLFFPNTIDHQYRYVAENRKLYEFHYLHYLRHVGRAGRFRTAYDIGTCFANHSLFFGAAMGCRVYCFEPNAALHEAIRTTLDTNGVAYDLFGVALADARSTGSLEICTTNIGSSRVIGAVDGADTFEIHTLDAMVQEAALTPPDFLKIDTEGHELRVLTGARALLREHRPDVFVEIERPNATAVFDLMTELGYGFVVRIGKNYHFSARHGAARRLPLRVRAIGHRAEKELFKARRAWFRA